ncbi:MAG: ATP-binding cassette domain-containing protein, partial [Actinobacteria bacterium]|nr:ATP-binding cassette domain-containing protein [Actinomycetota bacterium]
QDGRVYSITPTSPLAIATFTLKNAPSSTPLYIWPLIALGAFALSLLWVFMRRPRHPAVKNALKDVVNDAVNNAEPSAPLVSVRKLNKEYSDGYKAVTDLSFTVERGQVVGLLGPNGAGKTTTLRMLMGLIFPTSGEIEISGVPVFPGSRALAGLGSFVEGPGFLPHLTGSENLDLYWRSTGRSEDPEIADALEISGLGTAVNKKVRTYSQGMRQRLAIAQAMLGKPELLVLDEPTNGLDPTQIKAMRSILKNYADSGRTVIVSSHLLSEVEQTCSHVVVMHRGLLIASGTIDEILNRNGKRAQHLEEIFMDLVGTDTEIGI